MRWAFLLTLTSASDCAALLMLDLFIYFPAVILHQYNAVPSVLTLNRLKSICFDLKLKKKPPNYSPGWFEPSNNEVLRFS